MGGHNETRPLQPAAYRLCNVVAVFYNAFNNFPSCRGHGMSRSPAASGFFAIRHDGALARLTVTVAIAACVASPACQAPQARFDAQPHNSNGVNRMIEDPGKSGLVDYSADALAPEPPPIGIAISVGKADSEPMVFRVGDAIDLHG